MGALDVMFVLETPKAMFVLCTVVVLGFFLDAPPARAGESVSRADLGRALERTGARKAPANPRNDR